MNIKDLQTFLAVAELGSVTLAAQTLGRSQPSVTRCIQDLEADLGFDLFERVGRRVTLSPEGAAFEEEVRRLVATFDDLPARTLARAKGIEQPLTISATYALGTGLLPHAFERWPESERPAEIHLMQGAPNAVAQDLLAGRARVGLSSLPLDVPGLDCVRAFAAPVTIAMPAEMAADHPDGEAVSLKEFAARSLVTMLDQTRLQGRIAHALATMGVNPSRKLRVNSSVTALQLVRYAKVCAIVDPVTAAGATPPGVILRPLTEAVDFAFGFFLPEGGAPTQVVNRFLDLCETALLSLIPNATRTSVPGGASRSFE